MLFHVYHAKNPNFGFPTEGRPDPVFPEGFDHVATVDTVTLDEVFRVTNHIDTPWTENKEVVWLASKQVRSTSVGDIVTDGAGIIFRCAPIGWEKIVPLATKI